MNYQRTVLILTVFVFLLKWITGCAVNPATGQSDFVLMTEEQEIAIGRDENKKVLQYYSAYKDKALQDYVQKVGDDVANKSHRNNLVYRFTVLDSNEVNAFALPGGYIYITRGLMAYLNSEAELAAVLGHEIGHVTARHAVRQHSAATATGLLGTILSAATGVQGTGDLFNVLGTALVRGYGRDHELESDRLGAEYLARTGYDPQAMFNVIRVLKNQEEFETKLAKTENREPRIYHGVFSTHPDNDTRLKEVVDSAKSLKANGVKTNKQLYLDKTNGLVFGHSEEQGILRENHFYHKELGIALDLPEGWRVINQPDALVAHTANNDAFIHMTMQDLNKRITPREFMEQRLKLTGIVEGKEITVNGNKGYTGLATLKTGFGSRQGRVSVIYFNNNAFIFAGASKDANAPRQYDNVIMKSVNSFHALTSAEMKYASALRLKLVKVNGNTRFEKLAKSSRLTNYAEDQLRLLNSYYPSGEPDTGSYIKIVE